MSSGRLVVFALAGAVLAIACGSTEDGAEETDPQADGGSLPDGATPPGAVADGAAPSVTSDGGGADARAEASVADASLGPTYTGEATYYAADGTGACGYPATTNLDVAAMNKAQYAKSVCGKCVHLKGPKGEVTVRIVDLCPGCKMGDLDLSEESFAKIANMSAGRVKISWSFVACP